MQGILTDANISPYTHMNLLSMEYTDGGSGDEITPIISVQK